MRVTTSGGVCHGILLEQLMEFVFVIPEELDVVWVGAAGSRWSLRFFLAGLAKGPIRRH
jgi:hypothetical protein